MNADWEHFLNTVGSRYGLQEPDQETGPLEQVSPVEQAKPAKAGNRRQLTVLAVVLVVLLVLAVGVPMAWAQYGSRIPENVRVAGVEIGGMTKAGAVHAVKAAIADPLTRQNLVISLPGSPLELTPEQTGISLNAEALVADGRQGGGAGELTDLSPYLSLNEDTLRGILTEYAQQLSAEYAPSGYSLEGTIPALEEAQFDEAAPCPTLVLNLGTCGYDLNVDKLYSLIGQAYADGCFSVDAQSALTPLEPETLDLQQIEEQVCIAPVDARMDTATYTAIPGSYGIGFDREDARELLAGASSGRQVEVALHYLTPEIVGQEVYFQDVLGFCETPHSDNEKRTQNLRLACSVLNGIVLQPGETLSYNDTLGQRTAENGYQAAPAYSGTELVDSIGGGICQVSSTLYLSSLFAELETVERVNHGFPVSYIPYGLDATVNWGAPDLKIKNASAYPVKIIAEVKDSFVRIWIMGTETRDYYVRMGFGSSGSYARAYVCKYDRQTNEQISREQQLLSGYLGDVTSVKGEIGPWEIYVYGNVRPQESCDPTPETLEAARNYQKPNQHAQ